MLKNIRLLFGPLVALTFSSFCLADEAAAIAEIEKQGGTVRVIAKDSKDKEAAFHLSGKDITDDGIAKLKEVSNLVWLNLRGTKVSDDGLKHLADIKTLTRLHLEKTRLTDAGLAHLGKLENLEYLNLYATKVTDAGIDHLLGLKKLKKLYLWQSEVSKDGAEKLKASIPDLYVNLGADAEPGPPTSTLAEGRYVKIRLEGDKKILSLAEVQILETGTGAEIQKGAKAIQSSDHNGAAAARAIDGKPEETDYNKGSVTHTSESKNPWWLVDLGSNKDIGKIVVINRGDGNADIGKRIENAIIEVFDESLTVVYSGKITDAKSGSVSEFVKK